ncbi:hypothetical protein D3C80_1861120 [compost metagenome]
MNNRVRVLTLFLLLYYSLVLIHLLANDQVKYNQLTKGWILWHWFEQHHQIALVVTIGSRASSNVGWRISSDLQGIGVIKTACYWSGLSEFCSSCSAQLHAA